MSNKKQTALQKSISQLKQQKDTLKNHFEEGKWNDDRCSEIDNCIFILESNLAMEKEQMNDVASHSWSEGASYVYDGKTKFESFEQYYKETYEQ